MLKKSSSFVLAGHRHLTISAAFTNVPRFIQHGENSEAQRTEAYASPLRLLRPCWKAFLTILHSDATRDHPRNGELSDIKIVFNNLLDIRRC
jgi:hypothetical protein